MMRGLAAVGLALVCAAGLAVVASAEVPGSCDVKDGAGCLSVVKATLLTAPTCGHGLHGGADLPPTRDTLRAHSD